MSKKATAKSKSRKGLVIYAVIVTFVLVVFAALTVLQYATPIKPSNGFKRVAGSAEQTETLTEEGAENDSTEEVGESDSTDLTEKVDTSEEN